MNRKYLYPLLIVAVTALLFFAERYVDRQNEDYPNTSNTDKNFDSNEFNNAFLPTSTTGAIVQHGFFSLSYSEAHEQAEWVAYELATAHLSKTDIKRPYFVEDRSVKTKSADWKNYKNSGYDRGHLCPAGDRRFDYDAYHETFLTSNISPQDRDFNSGIWNRLEQKTRYWARKYDGVFVVTGGVLKEGLKTIGYENVAVPELYYKVILDSKNGAYYAIAFLIPNEPSNKSFFDYTVTIDTLENITGIDFFPNLSEAIQQEIEGSIDLKMWNNH